MKTLSKSMPTRFLVVLSVSGFHFGSKFARHSFSVNSFISKVLFPRTSCIVVFTIATIFARDSRQQYPFIHKCNSTLNTLSSPDSKSDRRFTCSYAILNDIQYEYDKDPAAHKAVTLVNCRVFS